GSCRGTAAVGRRRSGSTAPDLRAVGPFSPSRRRRRTRRPHSPRLRMSQGRGAVAASRRWSRKEPRPSGSVKPITARLRRDKRRVCPGLYLQPRTRYNRNVEFRILGPLQVLDGDAEVAPGSPKERALLAVLLLHAGEVVSRERLIDELWGESPPPTAAKALNVHVSQLRKTLAQNGHETIVTRPPGYTIEVEPDRLDAARFERLVATARERIAADDIPAASGLLRDS